MKPINQKEINKKFFDFMILFIICVAVFSFALYYDIAIGGVELKSLRDKVKQSESTFNKYDERYKIAEAIHTELNAMKEADRPIKQTEKSLKADRLNKMYSEAIDDTNNYYIKIFRITRESMINEIELMDSLQARKLRIAYLNEELVKAQKDLEDFEKGIIRKKILEDNEGQ